MVVISRLEAPKEHPFSSGLGSCASLSFAMIQLGFGDAPLRPTARNLTEEDMIRARKGKLPKPKEQSFKQQCVQLGIALHACGRYSATLGS